LRVPARAAFGSTWSEPLSRKLRSDRMTTSAVMPNVMTIAVSTSAWGSGSLCATTDLPNKGGRSTISRPTANRNRFTA
jgi:hypothetical protein